MTLLQILNKLKLRFTNPLLEQEYHRYHYQTTLVNRRLHLAFGVLLYIVLSIFEITTNRSHPYAFAIRVFVIAFGLVTFALTFKRDFSAKGNRIMSTLLLLFAGGGLLVMFTDYGLDSVAIFYTALTLMIFWGTTMPGTHYLATSLVCTFFLVATYVIYSFFIDTADDRYAMLYYLAGGYVLALMAGYSIESNSRTDFLQYQEINQQTNQLNDYIIALKSSEQKYSTLMDNASDGIIITRGLVIIYANRAMHDLLDFPLGSMKDTKIEDYIHPDSIDSLKKHIAQCSFNSPNQCLHESIMIASNNRPIWVEFNGTAINYDGEKALMIIVRDLSIRRQAEEKARESEETYRSVFNAVPDAILIHDPDDSSIIDANQAALKMFGRTRAELIKLSLQDISGTSKNYSNQKSTRNIQAAMQGNPQTFDWQARRSDGLDFWVSVSLKRGVIAGKTRVIAIIHDITGRKNSEQALREMNQELEDAIGKAQKLALNAELANLAKSEFIANMSHEIRTPLNAILGFSELIQEETTDAKHREFLTSIRNSGRNLLTLINDILDMSKIEAGRMQLYFEPVNLRFMFEEIQHIFDLQLQRKKIDLRVNIDKNLPQYILLDEVRLRQILFNLIGNAVKFTDAGYIEMRAIVKSNKDNNLDLLLEVEDTGAGIAHSAQQVIFEAFRQQEGQSTKRYGGTGLGLAITKRLAEMMNGDINVKSQVGKGSTFSINFTQIKAMDSKPGKPQEEDFNPRQIDFAPATIMVADDVDLNRTIIAEYFSKTKIKVIQAEDGDKALMRYRQYKPAFVLMDIRMPVLDGVEATRAIKKEFPNAVVVAFTASTVEQQEAVLRSDLFNDSMYKPIDPVRLVKTMMQYLKWKNLDQSTQEKPELDMDSHLELFDSRPKNLTDAQRANIHNALDLLKSEINEQWEQVLRRQSPRNLQELTSSLKDTGSRFKCSLISGFAKRLSDAITAFDIENIRLTLDDYPVLIDELKSMLEEGNDEPKPE